MKNKLLLLGIVMVTTSSCSTFCETHYFKDKIALKLNEQEKVANYYRLKIKGYSFLSSSRYVSGYFDQSALNLYFNEITQPNQSILFNSTTDLSGNQTLLSSEDGNELVLVFSTNAKAITDQIGSISKNQTILNSIASLTQKEEIKESLNVKADIENVNLDIQNFILTTDLYLKDLELKDKAEINNVIDQYIKSLIK